MPQTRLIPACLAFPAPAQVNHTEFISVHPSPSFKTFLSTLLLRAPDVIPCSGAFGEGREFCRYLY
jgi:hypothetical protein